MREIMKRVTDTLEKRILAKESGFEGGSFGHLVSICLSLLRPVHKYKLRMGLNHPVTGSKECLRTYIRF